MERNQVERLASLDFVRQGKNPFITGSCGTWKSFLATAIGYQVRKSIIITSQLPVSSWYDAVGDPTVADAILDRIVHSAHQIELTGESIRKMNARKGVK